MAFCQRCGSQLKENAAFCHRCGAPVRPIPQFPQYQPITPVPKKPIPGRGFGISSMVLGIIGLVYGVSCFFEALTIPDRDYAVSLSSSTRGDYLSSFFLMLVLFSSMSLMAIFFSNSARSRNYINGISKSGSILGWIGLSVYTLAAIVLIFSV